MNKRLIVTLAIISSITVGLCLYFSQKPAQAVPDAYISHSYTPEAMLTILNRIRAENGSKPLKLDPRLNQSAQAKADQLARDAVPRTANAHIDKNGLRATTTVPMCTIPSENIQIDQPNPGNASEYWLQSKSHKEAMLSDQWEITGFGIKDGYIVNHFCDII